MNNKENLKKLTLCAMLTAMTAVATILIQIPTLTKGYVNLGDCIVNVSAWLIGVPYGALAAGIGSALADVITGYFIYAPVTFFIKALMAVVSFYTFNAVSRKSKTLTARITASVMAEIVMALGYTMYEVILYHSWTYAVIGIYGNIAQGVMGVLSSVAVYELVIKKIPKKI